jgi:hypothetical protein
MNTREIKAMIALRGEDIETVGALIDERPNRISDTINYKRINTRIRDKLARHLNLPVEILFDQPLAAPKGRQLLQHA